MAKIKPLNYQKLRQKLDISQLHFKNTNEIKLLAEFIGQERALGALVFGIGIKSEGYNLYAMGPSGIGKRSLVTAVLRVNAKKSPTPPDWVYVYNFSSPDNPTALRLPAGRGYVFREDIRKFIDELSSSVLAIFEGDEYNTRMKKINNYYDKKRKLVSKKNSLIDKTPKLYKEQHAKEKSLQLKIISLTVKPLIIKLKRKYAKLKSVSRYLNAMNHDIVPHICSYIKHDDKINLISFTLDKTAFARYDVNLIVDNRKLKGAPIIFEESPTFANLICRIEHTTIEGSLTTNFNLIKAGSLHQANGGYLIIESRKIKNNIEAWEALKSALFSGKIKIKPTEDDPEAIKTVSLKPTPIPLNHIKIILIGSRSNYYELCEDDSDFINLFKIPVDFDDDIPRNQRNIKLYARLIATIIKRKKLYPFQANAVAAIIDHSSRLVDDIKKLSTHIRRIEDLILESDYFAKRTKRKIVNAKDVKNAIDAKMHRMDRSKEIYYEDIKRNFIIIKTSGKAIGQVNCLSVRNVGDFSYGHPTRVTARIRLTTKGKFIDIQREINMAGPIHSKAGLIICNYLATKFNSNHCVSLLASIAFEQIYCWTDGDSASVGELCALLSALSNVPLYQNLAITGSIDQYGDVQAIGGANEKIEGFFDVCKSKGTGKNHGVIIPAVNVQNLILREDILAAVKAKKFFIYPIRNIDEAISLLTGWETGVRDKSGNFPKNTLYHEIEQRLYRFSKSTIKQI